MAIVRLDHVQVACPQGGEVAASEFYGGLLQMPELAKPPTLAARGGVWFRAGAQQLHVGIEEPFVPARKAHPAVAVDDLDSLAVRRGWVWSGYLPSDGWIYTLPEHFQRPPKSANCDHFGADRSSQRCSLAYNLLQTEE